MYVGQSFYDLSGLAGYSEKKRVMPSIYQLISHHNSPALWNETSSNKFNEQSLGT